MDIPHRALGEGVSQPKARASQICIFVRSVITSNKFIEIYDSVPIRCSCSFGINASLALALLDTSMNISPNRS